MAHDFATERRKLCVEQKGVFRRHINGIHVGNEEPPSICACDAKFTLEHTLSCHLGGYIIRHNNLRDLGANLMREISRDVRVEPPLLEVSSQETTDLPKSAIKGDEACGADFSANGFWQRYQRAFFDVKVCNLLAPSYRSKLLANTNNFIITYSLLILIYNYCI